MAFATHDGHSFALSSSALAGLFGLIGGGPVVQPGLLYNKLDDGRWAVSAVYPGGPAEAAGVQRGDVLLTVGGWPVLHGFMDFAPYLGAPDGTNVELVIERGGKNQTALLRLTPVAAPIIEQRILAGNVGYIRIWACTHSDDAAKDAAKLVEAALATFDKKSVKKLVVDLRGNSGGFPFDLASLFVPADPLLLAINSDGVATPVPRTSVKASATKRSVAVLVDEMTASGGEMLALVLHDHAGAKIIGRPTFGALTFPTIEKHKGAPDVQVSYPLSRVGSAVTKAVLDGNHLVPEVEVQNPLAADYASRKDPQLDAAIATLKK
jgi:C-terminal processing protease CtpA/Prc